MISELDSAHSNHISINAYHLEKINTFSFIYSKFLPKIQKLASTYPQFWYEDFVQEGIIGLNKAYQKFNNFENKEHFASYAISCIRRRMIDFYRSRIKRYPTCIAVPKIYEDEEELDYFEQVKDPQNLANSMELRVDIQEHLNPYALRKMSFSEKEIEIFQLYFIEDQSMTVIAQYVNLSIPQVSKIISKLKSKIKIVFNN